jgi:hypothetical protein
MKLILTHECGDILLINPELNSNQLVTCLESLDKSNLKRKYQKTCLIDYNVKKEHFASVFCMMIPKGVEISESNIENDKITLYTFTDASDNLKFDVSKMYIQNTNLNIATHFLRHISTIKYGCDDYKKHIINHTDIICEINTDCRRKMECDIRVFKETNEICINDTYERSLCHSFVKKMIMHAKHRFKQCERDEIIELPFKRDDYVYYKYICLYEDIEQVYMIRIILV